jgi:hypothetical protein
MPFSDDEEFLTEAELANQLKRSRRQLQRDRADRREIPFVLFGTQVRYRLGDVRAYIARHLVGSTVEARAVTAAVPRIGSTNTGHAAVHRSNVKVDP